MRWSMAWSLVLVWGIALGCGHQDNKEGPLSPDKVSALENGLRSKPPLEAAKEQYRAAVSQMADAIAALVPGLSWRVDTDSWNHCGGDYVWTDAKMAYLMVVFSGPIPDDKWTQAVQIVRDDAKQFGATNYGVMKNQANDHDVYVAGQDGVEFKLSSQKTAVLTAQSDCRISQTDTPTPSETPHT
ncbi:MAG TPA: LppA family lipoprotein [Mycobacterium sp.]|jgi:hypothetical protein|uniref:LppA family lipoprotein n=1 Tax=Mycobacterium sp. TaxID=1785 RepID=UPI002D6FFFC3|nr:LppA family lipoprotein [Mycobacterium sp.]HZU48266.1 LppA family lipoprotein [Mycobacterium sp.]